VTGRSGYQQVKRANAIRMIAFMALTAVLATSIVLTFGKVRFGGSTEYHAVFSNVSGLVKGSDVRAAGVSVGSVGSMELRQDHRVLVTFKIQKQIPLTDATKARVRYANLTGDRYLELTSAPTGRRASLAAGATIPASRTTPALDLDLLFNGFRPLTRALDPAQVNELTKSVLAVSQGQGAALDNLLSHIASLTNTLGDRGTLIAQVIDNLTKVLGTVDSHRDDLAHLIDGLNALLTGLAHDRHRIGNALASLGDTAQTGSGFLRAIRPELKEVLAQLRRMAAVFNGNSAAANRYLRQLPQGIQALGRGGAYGSFFNFYLCGVRFKVDGANGPQFTPFMLSQEYRCKF
jgi:phospholipid/cholesterol/gamma-HCH transport system substrate-binding protein